MGQKRQPGLRQVRQQDYLILLLLNQKSKNFNKSGPFLFASFSRKCRYIAMMPLPLKKQTSTQRFHTAKHFVQIVKLNLLSSKAFLYCTPQAIPSILGKKTPAPLSTIISALYSESTISNDNHYRTFSESRNGI